MDNYALMQKSFLAFQNMWTEVSEGGPRVFIISFYSS